MNKYYMAALVLCWGIMVSCEDFLDKQPESQIAPESFFRTEKDLALYCNSFYNAFPSAEGVYNEDVDNIIKQSPPDLLTGKRTIPNTGGGWNWGDLRNINYFLGNYNRSVPEAKAARYAAVARFFRAYFYFDKVQRFGDVPWYSATIDYMDTLALKRPRDPRTLVMDSVLADVNYAIANLPSVKNVEQVTKWTALALKSRIGLYEGTFRKYHKEYSLPGAEDFLKESANASRELITKGPYSIYKSSKEKAYLELFASENAIDQEVILARRFNDALAVRHNVNYYTITASYGKPGLNKDLVDSYLMADGTRFTDKPGYQHMQFAEEVINRDPRLSQTVRTPGYKRIGGTSVEVPQFGNSVTGYQIIKFVGDVKYDSNQSSINDMPVFRLAEVLLNYAEALAELGQLKQTDLDLSVNRLRERVDMPNMNMMAANKEPDPYLEKQYPNVEKSDYKGVILEIRRERRIELVMESFRWDDLMRWKEGNLLKRPFKGMFFPGLGLYDLDGDKKPDVQIYKGAKPKTPGLQLLKLGDEVVLENGEQGGNVLVNPHIQKQFDESKDYLFPIPSQEIKLNPNLVQNPNWK